MQLLNSGCPVTVCGLGSLEGYKWPWRDSHTGYKKAMEGQPHKLQEGHGGAPDYYSGVTHTMCGHCWELTSDAQFQNPSLSHI